MTYAALKRRSSTVLSASESFSATSEARALPKTDLWDGFLMKRGSNGSGQFEAAGRDVSRRNMA